MNSSIWHLESRLKQFGNPLCQQGLVLSLVRELNSLAISWDWHRARQSSPSDFRVGQRLREAAGHAAKLVEVLPVDWEEDMLVSDETPSSEPRGSARFMPGPQSCNPRLAESLQAAIEERLEEADLDEGITSLPDEWPADLTLQLQSFTLVLQRAADALQVDERKETPSRKDQATVDLARKLGELFKELFGNVPAVWKYATQEPNGPWLQFLGKIFRALPGLEGIDDFALKNLTERHVTR